MNKLGVLFASLLFFNICHSQQTKIRFPIGFFNKDSTTVIGINTGFMSLGYPRNKTIGLHLELFGLGEMMAHEDDNASEPYVNSDSAHLLQLKKKVSRKKIYGVNISGLGLFCRSCDVYGFSINGYASATIRMNGIYVTGLISFASVMNGLQFSLTNNFCDVMNGLQISAGMNEVDIISRGIQVGLSNKSKHHTGLQIGIINKTAKLTGLQIGIWNTSGKRKLPLINW